MLYQIINNHALFYNQAGMFFAGDKRRLDSNFNLFKALRMAIKLGKMPRYQLYRTYKRDVVKSNKNNKFNDLNSINLKLRIQGSPALHKNIRL